MSDTVSPARRPPTAAEASGELSHRQILTIMVGLMLGMFLAALDQMIVSTAIRTIGDDLHGLQAQAWVTTAFLITSTISTPLYGKLSDMVGRKKLFLFAITVFILGSALCGLSTSMYMLAGFRAFQGIGAGGLMSLALAIIGDIIPPRQRARYQGYFMAVFATSSVLGPVIGGFFAGQSSILGVTGWRWIFYINVPIGILALIVVSRVLPEDRKSANRHAVDWPGAVALIVGLVPLLIVAEQGQDWGWGSPASLACYLIGAAGLIAFVRLERRAGENALLPLRLFRNRVFATASGQSFIIGIGMFGGMACVPLYLQIVKGASPTKAGLLVLPMVAGIMVASLVAGQITARTGHYRMFPIVGSALLVLGMFLLATVGADTALYRTDLFMVIFGLGLGLNMQTLVLAMQNAVPAKDMGVATAAGTFFRQVGGTLGTAIFLSILFTAASHKIPTQLAKSAGDKNWPAAVSSGHLQSLSPAWQHAIAQHPNDLKTLGAHLGSSGLNDTAFLSKIDSTFSHPFLVGFSQAMDLVFIVGGSVLIIALILSLFLKEVPLRMVSGNQARAQADTQSTSGDSSAESVVAVGGRADSTSGARPSGAGASDTGGSPVGGPDAPGGRRGADAG